MNGFIKHSPNDSFAPLQRRCHLERLEEKHLLTTFSCADFEPFEPAANSYEYCLYNAGASITEMQTHNRSEGVRSQSVQNATAKDPGNFFTRAFDIGTLDSFAIDESVSASDPRDFYQFDLKADSRVNVSISNLTGNAKLLVYDANRNLVDELFEPGSRDASMQLDLVQGQYFVRINRPYRAAADYSLSLEVMGKLPSPDPDSDPATQFPDVPYFGSRFDWNLNAIDAPKVWAEGITGEEVVVAVIDTGVDYFHTDLNDNIWVNSDEIAGNGIDDDNNGFIDDFFGWDFVSDDSSPLDTNGHGTHVAGTIAAENNSLGVTGVAYNASIMSIRVLDSNGSGFLSDVAAGIVYAVDNGADVINLSLGGGSHSVQIYLALQFALDQGVFVSVAAGNESANEPGIPARYSSVLDNVISVGAHDSSNVLAGFSNEVGSSRSVQVDAPGVSIASTFPQNRYRLLNGTSMAAPHVSGLAALILSVRPDLTPQQVRTAITDGAETNSILFSDSLGSINVRDSLISALQLA